MENMTKRVGRILSGSFNSLIGAFENAVPETVMEEALREVDGAVDDVRAELGKVVANKHLANKRLAEEKSRHRGLAEKAALAVSEGRDDLAEAAIAQQLDIEVQIPVLETTITECTDQEKELEGYIAALQARRRQMKDDLKQFRQSRQEAASHGASCAQGDAGSVEHTVGRAEAAFERVMEQATGISPTAAAFDKKAAAKMAELEDLSRRNRIQERLAAVKGSVGEDSK